MRYIAVIATRLRVGLPQFQGLIPGGRLGIFLFTTAFRTALGAHPASYPMGTGVSFPGGKAARE
jgi:hypothetical protein